MIVPMKLFLRMVQICRSHTLGLIFAISYTYFSFKKYTLCSSFKKNLLSVDHFTKENNVFIKFHPYHFFLKDQTAGVTFYTENVKMESTTYRHHRRLITPSKKVANVHERTRFGQGINYKMEYR